MTSALVEKEAPDFTLDRSTEAGSTIAEQRGQRVRRVDFWAGRVVRSCLQKAMPVIDGNGCASLTEKRPSRLGSPSIAKRDRRTAFAARWSD